MGNGYSENYKYGWGHFIYNLHQDSDPTIAIHVNHPLNDRYTNFLAGYIFENIDLKPKWMISAGAHRYSWVDIDNIPEECDEGCDEETNFGADVARVENDCNEEYTTLFQT